MLGPNYGKWWNERPRYARLRLGLIILPVVLILPWVLYQYTSGVHLRDDILDAFERGNLGDIRALIMDGAPVDARHNNGKTLLHRAIAMGHLKVVPLFIKEGADVNAVDHRGITPLHWVAESGHRGIAELLLEHGASTITLDSHRLTPADRAREEGQNDLVALFNTVNGSGKSGIPDFTRSSENYTMDEECVFPKRMHSTSRMVLADYLDGQTLTAEFLRLFSLTNSRYLELGNCLVRLH